MKGIGKSESISGQSKKFYLLEVGDEINPMRDRAEILVRIRKKFPQYSLLHSQFLVRYGKGELSKDDVVRMMRDAEKEYENGKSLTIPSGNIRDLITILMRGEYSSARRFLFERCYTLENVEQWQQSIKKVERGILREEESTFIDGQGQKSIDLLFDQVREDITKETHGQVVTLPEDTKGKEYWKAAHDREEQEFLQELKEKKDISGQRKDKEM